MSASASMNTVRDTPSYSQIHFELALPVRVRVRVSHTGKGADASYAMAHQVKAHSECQRGVRGTEGRQGQGEEGLRSLAFGSAQ